MVQLDDVWTLDDNNSSSESIKLSDLSSRFSLVIHFTYSYLDLETNQSFHSNI